MPSQEYSTIDQNSDILTTVQAAPPSASRSRRGAKRSGGGRGRGRSKRQRVEEPAHDTQDQVPPAHMVPQAPPPDANMVLKYTYGVNAWKHWVLQKNAQLEKASKSSSRLKLFKTDILQCTADELNYSLCLFVKEVRKPNCEEYAPDSIYYLCLGESALILVVGLKQLQILIIIYVWMSSKSLVIFQKSVFYSNIMFKCLPHSLIFNNYF